MEPETKDGPWSNFVILFRFFSFLNPFFGFAGLSRNSFSFSELTRSTSTFGAPVFTQIELLICVNKPGLNVKNLLNRQRLKLTVISVYKKKNRKEKANIKFSVHIHQIFNRTKKIYKIKYKNMQKKKVEVEGRLRYRNF